MILLPLMVKMLKQMVMMTMMISRKVDKKFYSSSGLEAHLLICFLPPTSSNPDFKSYIFGEPTNLSPQSNWFLEIFLNIFLKRSKSPTFCSVMIGCHPLELSTKFVLNISNVFHFHILRLISIPTISQIQIFYLFHKRFQLISMFVDLKYLKILVWLNVWNAGGALFESFTIFMNLAAQDWLMSLFYASVGHCWTFSDIVRPLLEKQCCYRHIVEETILEIGTAFDVLATCLSQLSCYNSIIAIPWLLCHL